MYKISLVLYLFTVLIIFNIYHLKCAKVSVIISPCNDLKSDWEYCINSIQTNRSWYQAAAECRSYRGELVALESQEKTDAINAELKARFANLSTTIFVNANRPFYSRNNNFAWSSGIELQLSASNNMEECVMYSVSNLNKISCDRNYSVSLVCQRPSQRIVRTHTSEQLTVLLSKTNINYSHESCDYLTFAKFDYNWYQAKKLCETFNSELLGIPSKPECRLVEKCKGLAVQSNGITKHPKDVFLDMHLHMYARNVSIQFFRDPSGERVNESLCDWNIKLQSYSEDEFCVSFEEGKTLSPFKCVAKASSDLIGFICKQCHLSKVSIGTESVVRHNVANPSVTKATLRTSEYAFFLGVISILVITIILLVECLVLSYIHIHCIRRRINSGESARVGAIELTEYTEPVQSPCPESSVYDYASPNITSLEQENYRENNQQLETSFMESSTYDYVLES